MEASCPCGTLGGANAMTSDGSEGTMLWPEMRRHDLTSFSWKQNLTTVKLWMSVNLVESQAVTLLGSAAGSNSGSRGLVLVLSLALGSGCTSTSPSGSPSEQ